MEEIIEVKNVIKKFKDKTALNGLNFKVQKGKEHSKNFDAFPNDCR
jgi:ABC-type multidrug transport system ATPase subunit